MFLLLSTAIYAGAAPAVLSESVKLTVLAPPLSVTLARSIADSIFP